MSRKPVFFKGGNLLLDESGMKLGYGAFESNTKYKTAKGYVLISYGRIIDEQKTLEMAKNKAKLMSKRKEDEVLICKKIGRYIPY